MGNLLEIEEVGQSFRTGFWMKPVPVLKKVSFTVPEGSVFGFLGANGAGKTTLIHLIAGLRRPTRGSVKVFGFEATSIQAKSRMGYLPERPYFHEHLTGEGILYYYGILAGMKRSEIQSRIPIVLKAVSMTNAGRVELRRYSKGMLQRIGIAQAMIHDPEFLVLDEPMSGLDPLGRKEIRELIRVLSAEGRTIFFSSHVIPDVEAICDRVALIQKGELVGCGPITEFLYSASAPVEIAFRPVSSTSSWSEFESISEIPEGKKGVVRGQESVDRIVAKLVSEKAQILSINPIRSSLENYFAADFEHTEKSK